MCISYLTIEHDGHIPERFREEMSGWVFGCDTCQDVCPWNRFAKPSRHKDFDPRDGLILPDLHVLSQMDADEFDALTNGTSLHRTGREKLRRNALAVMGLL
jgi:epoxyqueuosine reductase